MGYGKNPDETLSKVRDRFNDKADRAERRAETARTPTERSWEQSNARHHRETANRAEQSRQEKSGSGDESSSFSKLDAVLVGACILVPIVAGIVIYKYRNEIWSGAKKAAGAVITKVAEMQDRLEEPGTKKLGRYFTIEWEPRKPTDEP